MTLSELSGIFNQNIERHLQAEGWTLKVISLNVPCPLRARTRFNMSDLGRIILDTKCDAPV